MGGQVKAPMLLGAHMSIQGGVDQALVRGQRAGCLAVQIFTRGNNQWYSPPLSDEEIEQFRQQRVATGVGQVFSHDSYLINLASADAAIYARSMAAMRDELQRAAILGLSYVVMHPGSHKGVGEEAGIERIAASLRVLLAESDPSVVLLLENTAGQGTSVGCRFEHLAAIIEQVGGAAERVGVCIDTCHTYAAGYDISTPDGYARTFDEFDRVVGLRRIKAFHLNDSKKGLGCRVDRHEHIGQGALGLEAFRCLMNDARFAGVPMVLETPKGDDDEPVEDVKNLEVLRGLVVGVKSAGIAAARASDAKPSGRVAPEGVTPAARSGRTRKGRSGELALSPVGEHVTKLKQRARRR